MVSVKIEVFVVFVQIKSKRHHMVHRKGHRDLRQNSKPRKKRTGKIPILRFGCCHACKKTRLLFTDSDHYADNAIHCLNGHSTCFECIVPLVQADASDRRCNPDCIGFSYFCPKCHTSACLNQLRLLTIFKGSFDIANSEYNPKPVLDHQSVSNGCKSASCTCKKNLKPDDSSLDSSLRRPSVPETDDDDNDESGSSDSESGEIADPSETSADKVATQFVDGYVGRVGDLVEPSTSDLAREMLGAEMNAHLVRHGAMVQQTWESMRQPVYDVESFNTTAPLPSSVQLPHLDSANLKPGADVASFLSDMSVQRAYDLLTPDGVESAVERLMSKLVGNSLVMGRLEDARNYSRLLKSHPSIWCRDARRYHSQGDPYTGPVECEDDASSEMTQTAAETATAAASIRGGGLPSVAFAEALRVPYGWVDDHGARFGHQFNGRSESLQVGREDLLEHLLFPFANSATQKDH